MSVAKRFAWNSLVAWASNLFATALAFLIVRFLREKLGLEGYGVAEIFDSLIAITLLLDFGLRGALGRHLAEQVERNDREQANSLFVGALFCYVVAGLVLAGICSLFAEQIVDAFHVHEQYRAQAASLVRFYISIYTVLAFISPALGSMIEAYHRFDVVDWAHVSDVTTRTATIVVLLSTTNLGLYGWAIGMLTGASLRALILLFFAKRFSPWMSAHPRYLSWNTFPELFSLGGMVFLYQAVLAVTAQMDPLILGKFLGPRAVAIYKPALRVVIAAQPFTHALNRQLIPLATSYFVKGREDFVRELFVRGTRMSLTLSVLFTVGFSAFAFPLMNLWLADGSDSDRDIWITAAALILWAIAEIPNHFGGTQWAVMLGMNRIRYVVTVQSIGAAVNFVLSITLVATLVHWNWDAGYCILSPILPKILVNWVQRALITRHAAHETQVGLWPYLRSGILGPATMGIALGASVAVPLYFFMPRTWPALVVGVALTGLLWLVLAWLIALDPMDRQRLAKAITRLMGRRGAEPATEGAAIDLGPAAATEAEETSTS